MSEEIKGQNGQDQGSLTVQPQSSRSTGTTSRRKFNHGVVGSAVLLTLGNRVAWGRNHFGGNGGGFTKKKTTYDKKVKCISYRVWESYQTGNPSHIAKGGKHYKEIQKFERFRLQADRVFERPGGSGEGRQICAVKRVSQDNGGRFFGWGDD